MGAVVCCTSDANAQGTGDCVDAATSQDFTDVIPQGDGNRIGKPTSEMTSSGESERVAPDAERRASDENSGLVVTLDRSGGASLGIAVKKHRPDGKLYVHALGERGLVPTWNAANPSTEVSIGDRIVEVNGASGDPKLLIDEMHKVQVLSIRLEKAEMDVGNGVAS
eukprot:CAMPEP_0117569126 /NCGR_PEP_ID=MMETSP0784-20121206/58497_1 /TAXON_ID=39447 /ORGANISM="" /LENGTH=165 /DNA_ID=CAMNT_0005367089 /DNA_START=61 /DNA_END=558 /DNA_ORIENTATION=+